MAYAGIRQDLYPTHGRAADPRTKGAVQEYDHVFLDPANTEYRVGRFPRQKINLALIIIPLPLVDKFCDTQTLVHAMTREALRHKPFSQMADVRLKLHCKNIA